MMSLTVCLMPHLNQFLINKIMNKNQMISIFKIRTRVQFKKLYDKNHEAFSFNIFRNALIFKLAAETINHKQNKLFKS